MKTGDKVVFAEHSNEQVQWSGGNDPLPTLTLGHEYTVERVDVRSWHTKVWLIDHGGPYNSVHFRPAPSTRQKHG